MVRLKRIVLPLIFCALPFVMQAQEYLYPYSLFSNSNMTGNYFFSAGSYTVPSSVALVNDKLPVSTTVFHTPGNAIELKYTNGKAGTWKAAIYKQRIRGQDHFLQATQLSFWVKTLATNSAASPAVQLVKADSSLTSKQQFQLRQSQDWQQVTIPLDKMDASLLAKPTDLLGVVFSQNGEDGQSQTIYIDDIELISTQTAANINTKPAIDAAKGYAMHVDLALAPITDASIRYVKIYRSENGKSFFPIGVQYPFIHRYADYTGKANTAYQYKIAFLNAAYQESPMSEPVSASTHDMTDEALLDMIQEANFRYYWEGAETISGLAKENIPGRHNMIASGASGFGIMALIAGTERKFITRQQAVTRFKRIVNFLSKAETFHGAFPHFIDGPTGKVEPFFGQRDNGGDLVETSFLMQGLLTAKAYFNGNNDDEKFIRDKITAIWQGVEWDWYKQFPDSKFLYWHWSPDKAWVINHRLIGWNETMVTYLLAIASPTHGVPGSMYYSGWASQDSFARQYRMNWGHTPDGSMYTNGNTYFDVKLDVGVSNGGPLFFTHYSYLGYDPHKLTDKYTNYFANNQHIAMINHRYCVDNPKGFVGYGDGCWGLTACDGPYHYNANEPVPAQDKGIMAPTGALSSFPYLPEAAMKALKNYYFNYGKFLWGEYGFKDAFSLSENWCSDIYMGLNQAPITVMIENYRSGLLWNLFMSNDDIKNGLEKIRTAQQ